MFDEKRAREICEMDGECVDAMEARGPLDDALDEIGQLHAQLHAMTTARDEACSVAIAVLKTGHCAGEDLAGAIHRIAALRRVGEGK